MPNPSHNASDTRKGHTPGPWECQVPEEDGSICIIGANLGGLVGAALCWPTEIETCGSDRVKANARLIAEAPAMLEALRGVIPANVCTTNPNVPDDMDVHLTFSMGELRRIAAILARIDGGQP